MSEAEKEVAHKGAKGTKEEGGLNRRWRRWAQIFRRTAEGYADYGRVARPNKRFHRARLCGGSQAFAEGLALGLNKAVKRLLPMRFVGCQRPPALPCGLPAAGFLVPLESQSETTAGMLPTPPRRPAGSTTSKLSRSPRILRRASRSRQNPQQRAPCQYFNRLLSAIAVGTHDGWPGMDAEGMGKGSTANVSQQIRRVKTARTPLQLPKAMCLFLKAVKI